MVNLTDTFFIILFAIVVATIIGLNIVNVVDKKISNVSVNIPPINIPKQNIILSVDDKDQNKLSVCACDIPDQDRHQTQTEIKPNNSNLLPLNNDNKDRVEGFIVHDAQDFHHYDENKEKTSKKPDNYDKEKMKNPEKDCIIDYDKEFVKEDDFQIRVTNHDPPQKYEKGKLDKSYVCSGDFGWQAPNQYVSCANASIAEQYKGGKKMIIPNQISCGHPNKLTAENYYKTFYKRFAIPIEDYKIRGYNYQDFLDYPTPYQVRTMRILSTNTKGLPPEATKYKNIPVGYNYTFHNTPAMAMP